MNALLVSAGFLCELICFCKIRDCITSGNLGDIDTLSTLIPMMNKGMRESFSICPRVVVHPSALVA